MTHTYLFALTDGGGTVPPEIGVARRLVDEGRSVTVLADASMADQVRRSGATFLAWTPNGLGELRDWEIRNPMKLMQAMADTMIAGPAELQASDTAAQQGPRESCDSGAAGPGRQDRLEQCVEHPDEARCE